MKQLTGIALLALLGACGAREPLQPAAGNALPVQAYGAAKPADAAKLMQPPIQTRPARSDDLLRSSDERRNDDFDLPPPK